MLTVSSQVLHKSGRRSNTFLLLVISSVILWQQSTAGVCPTDWTPYGEFCYSVVVTPDEPFDNVYQARESCLQGHADLVTIENATVEEFIFSLILNQSTQPSYAYIGLTDLEEEGNFTWLDGSAYSYSNFIGDQPDNEAEFNGEHCVAISSSDRQWKNNSNTGWHDVPCCFQELEINTAVCRKPVDSNITVATENNTIHSGCFGNCPPNWYKYEERCFTLLTASVPSTSTFNSTVYARDVCQGEHADLPSVTSQGVGFHLTSILRQEAVATDIIYLGINDVESEGTYKYLNGSDVQGYTNWPGGSSPAVNSSINCVVLSSSDQSWSNNSNLTVWRDINCCSDQGVSWVMCERPELNGADVVDRDANVFARACFLHLNECDSNPCQNGATCEDHVMYYECICIPGYTGANCETQIDYCESDPCQNDGTCNTLVNEYSCTCTPGYNGTDCEELYDHCLAFEHCENNSTCINYVTYSNCTCLDGFDGIHCETNIDDCERLNITCINGGTCQDGIMNATCECPVGFGGLSCENELLCPTNNLDVANSTKVNDTGNKVGDFVLYECFPGHKFPDMERTKTLVCEENGWNNSAVSLPLPACERHCDFLPEVAFSTPDNTNTKVGQVVNFTCLTGFKLANNDTGFNITCQENGNWTLPIDEIPQCEIVTCPELPVYEHQTLKTRNNTYNTTIVFWCDVGYVLHDNTTARTIKCLADGDWTATLPPCLPVECPVIPELTGLSRNTSDNIYNTYAKFTCNNGLRMDDGATYRIIKCDATAEWSDDVTMCADDRCFPLPYVANATPSDTLAIFGHEVKLSCIAGHRFNQTDKSRNMTCNPTTRWSPLLSSCEPVYCEEVPSNINSSPNTTNTLFGTVVDISCFKGHYFPDDSNSIITQCMDSETWNITEVDPCWPIVCPVRPTITNGNILFDPPHYNYSQQVKYECNDQFKFIDGNRERTITCNEYGQWDLTDVSCRKERCDPVPTAFMAVPDTTNTSWHTVVDYQCDVGYHWENRLTYTIECKNTGFWNDTDVPPCIINECDPVPQMNNATVNGSDHVYNTFIEYECDPGFKYSDEEKSKTRWCSPEKLWEPVEFPTCNIIFCPELPDIENATKNSNDTEYLTEVTYNCEPGYQFPDKDRFKVVACTANETWTELQYTFCEVVFCPPVPYWDATFNSTDNEFHAVVTYKCKGGYAFEDSNRDVNVEKIARCIEAKVWEPPIQSCVHAITSKTLGALESIAKDLQGVVYEAEEAVPIGTIACTLMCLLLAAIILLDLHKLLEDLKMMKRNIQSMLDDRNNKISDSSQDIKNAAESVA